MDDTETARSPRSARSPNRMRSLPPDEQALLRHWKAQRQRGKRDTRPPGEQLPLADWGSVVTVEDAPETPKMMEDGAGEGKNEGGERVSGRLASLTPAETRAVYLACEQPGMPASHVAESIGSAPNGGIARRLGAGGDLRAHVRALLTEAGFDDKAIVSKWASLANAKRTEFFSYQGQVLDQREVEALDIQVKGVDALTRLSRLYPVTDEEAAARGAGPPALVLQLNLVPPALVDASVLTVALGTPPIDDTGVLDAETGPDRT